MRVKTIQVTDNTAVIEGLNKSVDIIKSTMGAKGNFVTIYEDGEYRVTKDGVSVADSINLPGVEGIGSAAVKSTAQKTVSQVGDGTTGTSVLLQALVNKAIIHKKGDINSLIKGMELGVEKVISYVQSKSLDLKEDYTKLEQIASVASNSKVLGKLIADCYKEVTMNSLVDLEKSSYERDTYFEVKQGMTFNSGMVHNGFANSHGGKCILEDAMVFTEKNPVRNFSKIHEQILEKALTKDKAVVIIAPEFTKQFLTICLTNKAKKGLKICLIKSPGYGDNIKENYKDITAYTEGVVDKIVVTREKFTLFNTPTEKVKERIKFLKKHLEEIEDYYEIEKTTQRIHDLSGTTGIIYTGGVTVEAQEEEYDRIEDALGSVKSSIRKGYVPGGGIALFNASKACQETVDPNLQIGFNIVLEACKRPLYQILSNANLVPETITQHLDTDNLGYNVITDEYCDMITEGIIDPTEVITESLTNALATTKLLINTKYNLINTTN